VRDAITGLSTCSLLSFVLWLLSFFRDQWLQVSTLSSAALVTVLLCGISSRLLSPRTAGDDSRPQVE
jgi:hypothetical protein